MRRVRSGLVPSPPPKKQPHLSGQGHASADQESRLGLPRRHHAEAAALHEVDQVLDLLLDGDVILVVLLLVRIGRLVARVRVREGLSGSGHLDGTAR